MSPRHPSSAGRHEVERPPSGCQPLKALVSASRLRALRDLLRRNRAFVARGQRDFSPVNGIPFRPAPVPVPPAR